MAQHKSRAFIVDARDYRESSKLLQLFCEQEGHISLVAKGLRSPKGKKAALADSFNLLQVTYTIKEGATLGLLTGLEAERVYPGTRASLESYALVNYWFEILKAASHARSASPDVFALTTELLEQADAPGNRAPHLSQAFPYYLLRLAEQLGFGLNLDQCAECGGTEPPTRVDLQAGTALCAGCGQRNRRSVLLPPALQAGTLPVTGRDEPLRTLSLLNEYLQLHLDHHLRTFPFLRTVLQPQASA